MMKNHKNCKKSGFSEGYVGLNMSGIEIGAPPPHPTINRIRHPKAYDALLKEIKEKYSD